MRHWIERWDSGTRWLFWVVQAGIFVASGTTALLLGYDFRIPQEQLLALAGAVAIWAAAKIAAFRFVNLSFGWWRYVSARDLTRITLGTLGGAVLGGLILAPLSPPGFPKAAYLLDFMMSLLGSAGVRLAVRLIWEASVAKGRGEVLKPTLIYGAGTAGIALLREIRNSGRLPYDVRGFVDDNAEKKGRNILGVRVFGGGEQIQALVTTQLIETILIAIPSATGSDMAKIVELCQSAGVGFKTIPGLDETAQNPNVATQIREVAIEDILGREPVHLEQEHIRERVEGEAVMVTGAAGSIGSELCRQLARFNPAVLVAFDFAETAVFHLEREMRRIAPTVRFQPEIGNIQNAARLDEVMQRFSPSAVFHAAAYKHVPLMEDHVCEAVENNVLGTHNVAAAAIRHRVANFVLISSDKAVRPVSIMGATKRAAELVALTLNAEGKTKFVCVRFGNVLGSNGSVLPIFKEQIAAGGPVTVTHPEIERYFMTISEAAQLALQAFSMGNGGEVFVLEMGKPVKILDLARKMISLSGHIPDRDIPIVFTGVRPGEKMYEELSLLNEGTVPTRHKKIRIFAGAGLPGAIEFHLDALRDASARRDTRALTMLLAELAPDFLPGQGRLDRETLTAYQ